MAGMILLWFHYWALSQPGAQADCVCADRHVCTEPAIVVLLLSAGYGWGHSTPCGNSLGEYKMSLGHMTSWREKCVHFWGLCFAPGLSWNGEALGILFPLVLCHLDM